MRASLRDIQLIEAYLLQELPPDEMDRFRQQLLIHPDVWDQVKQQQRTYRLIRQSGRLKLRLELEELHKKLFSEAPGNKWKNSILALFK